MADQTHHPECWRDPAHHACAVREVVRLRDLMVVLIAEADRRTVAFNRARRALERVEEGGE